MGMMHSVGSAVRRPRTLVVTLFLGAVAVATYGTAGSHLLHSEHLDPVWQAAVEVDLPICVHTDSM